jgi:nucleoside phosphorylase
MDKNNLPVDTAQLARVVIVTALPVEHAAIRSLMVGTAEERHPKGTIYDRGHFLSWDILLVQVGAGNTVAAQETERAITFFDPQLALFAGIAGGIKDVALGDVVAATKVYGYESGTDRDSFNPRPEVGTSSYPLVQEARRVARGAEWHERIQHTRSSTQPVLRAFVAPIAAGEKVIKASDGTVATLLRQSYGDALAVEMEGAGFLRAAYASSVDAIVIRGISDLLDGKAQADASGSQEIASDHAAAFAFELLACLSGKQAAEVASHAVYAATSVPNNSTDANEVDIWTSLRDLAPRLYPLGPQERDVWIDAGGDLSRLNLSEGGRTQWGRALRELEKGGGGKISLMRLLQRMLQDFGNNYELNFLIEQAKLGAH